MSDLSVVKKKVIENAKPSNNFLMHFVILVVSVAVTATFPLLQEVYESDGKAMVIGLAVSATVWMLCALLVGPIHVLKKMSLPDAKWMSIRRGLGIWTAMLLTVHLICLWKYFYNFEWEKAIAHSVLGCVILHAAVGYVILMGVTSNNFSMKLLGPKLWKNFHRGLRILFPVIAAEGVVQLYRIQGPVILMVIVGAAGVVVPILEVMAYKKMKRNK